MPVQVRLRPAVTGSSTSTEIRSFDAFAYRQAAHKLTRENIGVDNLICGKCIVVCPWTNRYLRRALSFSD
jgi:epoxyqueuosine reductase QueG